MSGPVKNLRVQPKILILDPDSDFLDSMKELGEKYAVHILSQLYTKRNPILIEELVMNELPDILVLNLDQEDELRFGNVISKVHSVPIPLPPIVLAITHRESLKFRKTAYECGADDYLVRPFSSHDLWLRLKVHLRTRHLQRQLDDATRKLSVVNVQLAESNAKLEEMTLTDELTGLYNMRFMVQFLEKQFELLSRYERPFSLMMLDLDHFKSVNDKNDHLVGSSAIRSMGKVILQTTRRSDIKARYGGDEYIIAMPETDATAARRAAERLRVGIENAVLDGINSSQFKITGSIGVATYKATRHHQFTDLVKDADNAMYTAKKQGRNRVVFFAPEVTESKTYDESQSSILVQIKKEIKT